MGPGAPVRSSAAAEPYAEGQDNRDAGDEQRVSPRGPAGVRLRSARHPGGPSSGPFTAIVVMASDLSVASGVIVSFSCGPPETGRRVFGEPGLRRTGPERLAPGKSRLLPLREARAEPGAACSRPCFRGAARAPALS